ncbi:DnaJ sub C member 1 [Saguinus oedipus]|uniref:DnaJ sub C member 1 n=1 Tax=Saguinus oedipus TaxID=9490 RepID=A0ABQ9V8K0_SAGOE|nr:DnaJ sub C member 1 [Saguinus oedipus]
MTAPGSRPAQLPGRRQLGLVLFPPPPPRTPLLWPLLLLLLAAVAPARGWESGDLELFDLVEEVQLNFYQFLGVQQRGQGRRQATRVLPREPSTVGKAWSPRALAALSPGHQGPQPR